MAIPKFKKEYVIEALKYINENGVPFHNQSTKHEAKWNDLALMVYVQSH